MGWSDSRMSNVTPFENKHMAVMAEIQALTKQEKAISTQVKDLKMELEQAMDEHNIKSIDNEFLKITRVGPSETTSIDIKKMKEKEPDLHEELLADYPKVTKRKAYVRFTVK